MCAVPGGALVKSYLISFGKSNLSTFGGPADWTATQKISIKEMCAVPGGALVKRYLISFGKLISLRLVDLLIGRLHKISPLKKCVQFQGELLSRATLFQLVI